MKCSICGQASYKDPCFTCRVKNKQSAAPANRTCSISGCSYVANITPHAHVPAHLIPELNDPKARYCIGHYYMLCNKEKRYIAEQRPGIDFRAEFFKNLDKIKPVPFVTNDPDIVEVF